MGGHIRTEPLEKRFILGIRHGIRSVILGGSFDLWVTGKREGREFNINITQMSSTPCFLQIYSIQVYQADVKLGGGRGLKQLAYKVRESGSLLPTPFHRPSFKRRLRLTCDYTIKGE